MAASNDEHQAGGPAGSDPPNGNSQHGFWKGLLGFDSWLHSAASLSIVTLLAGWVGTYIQYLNAYEQKVSTQAQADMQDATKAFVDISDAYAEAQMQQQVLYFNFSATEDDTADAGNKALTTAAAKDVYPPTSNRETRSGKTALSLPARRSSTSIGRPTPNAMRRTPLPSTAIR